MCLKDFDISINTGERLTYSMTSFLAFGVFISFILDSMPSSTDTLSIMAINMSAMLVMSALYVLLCILSLSLFYRDISTHPIPASLQSIVVWLELLICLGPPVRNLTKVHGIHVNTVDFNSKDSNTKYKVNQILEKWATAMKSKHTAYSDPEKMTWRRVSRTLDKLCFRLFFFIVVTNAMQHCGS